MPFSITIPLFPDPGTVKMVDLHVCMMKFDDYMIRMYIVIVIVIVHNQWSRARLINRI